MFDSGYGANDEVVTAKLFKGKKHSRVEAKVQHEVKLMIDAVLVLIASFNDVINFDLRQLRGLVSQ